MKNYQIDETTLHVESIGRGRPVVFLHGYPFDHSIWDRLFDAMRHCNSNEAGGQCGCRLIAPDLRGLGRSKLPDAAGPTTMQRFADDVHELLEAMDVTEKVVVCGLSMGGYVAMQYVEQYDDRVAGLVLCNTKTTADPPSVAENRRRQAAELLEKPNFLRSVAETMLPNLFSEKTKAEKPDVVQMLRTVIESNNARGAASATLGMALRSDTTELLRRLDVPVLVVCGSEDRFSPPTEMKPLAEIAQRGRYVEVSDAGHLTPLEQPERFAEVLTKFLNDLD